MATLTAQTRHSVTFTPQDNLGRVSYMTTDTPDYILVGSTESDYLILWGDMVLTAETKN